MWFDCSCTHPICINTAFFIVYQFLFIRRSWGFEIQWNGLRTKNTVVTKPGLLCHYSSWRRIFSVYTFVWYPRGWFVGHTDDFLICKFTIKRGKPVTQLPYLWQNSNAVSVKYAHPLKYFFFLFLVNRTYFSWYKFIYFYINGVSRFIHMWKRNERLYKDDRRVQKWDRVLFMSAIPHFVKRCSSYICCYMFIKI